MSSRKKPITQAIRRFRRVEAEKRLATYNTLTIKQKLEALPPEPHALRQRTRLMSLLNKDVPVVKVVETTPVASTVAVTNVVSADEKAAIKAEIKAKKFNKKAV
jgi:hypothetical protein